MDEEKTGQTNTLQDADTFDKAVEEYKLILENMDIMKIDIDKLLQEARTNTLK